MPVYNEAGERRCTKCKVHKLENGYNFVPRNGGYLPECRECYNAYHRNRYRRKRGKRCWVRAEYVQEALQTGYLTHDQVNHLRIRKPLPLALGEALPTLSA